MVRRIHLNMTVRKIGTPPGLQVLPVMQLFAETNLLAGTTNLTTGMTNPQMVDGTGTVDFTGIPSTYKDLKIVFSNMAHNTSNGSGYRIRMQVNNITATSRYYTRAGYQASGGASWNADSVDAFYYGYVYRPENVTWSGTGELNMRGYSQILPYNTRPIDGWWWHINQETYPNMYAGYVFNDSSIGSTPVNRLTFTLDGGPGFRAISKISLYGINPV